MKVDLVQEVELGRCQAASPIIHVVGERMETGGDRPLCNQGRIKFVVGARPTELTFPAEGDVSQVRIEQGLVCSKCLKVMQALERARAPAAPEAPAEPPANPLDEIAELKVQYAAGMIDWKTYDKGAHRVERRAREAGLLGGGGSAGQ